MAAGGGANMEEECEVVRVRVKKSEGQLPPEFRSFAVDPQITSLDVLQHILARAFDLHGKKSFSLSFATRDGQGQDTFVPLLSDSDLGTAFTCARPTLRLRLDVRNPPESPLMEDWDIISPREVAAVEPVPERRSLLAAALPFTQALLAQVGRTLARAQAALAWPEGTPPVVSPPVPAPCAPLGDADLRSYLGPGGRLLRPQELRLHVFHGGVEPGLRKVVWRYLLNVFPAGLSGQERLSHLRRKAAEYTALKAALVARTAPAELAQVGAAVRKDVVRTDRAHPYFGGPEEGHPHLLALQDLLTTFALGHPHLSYCQGMSDVAAPLLAVLDDEAQTYLCFCSLMRRLGPRFRPGGRGLARAFAHLRRLLRRADPPFWAFLAARGAHDLLFCYRWLLLELKREFAFEDALRVLEITWSSLPPAPPPPPAGVPLLGAPLGARGAQRGWRERRGLRPRLPRGRRRRRRRGGEEEEGGEGGGGGGAPVGGWQGAKSCSGGPGGDRDSQEGPKDSQEGPKSSSESPEGPKSSSDIQRCSKSSSGSPEGPSDTQEGPKSSSESPEGPKDTQESPRNSSESPEGPKSSSDTQEGPSDTQEGPKSSSESPEGDKDIQEGPKRSSESPEGPKSSSESPEGPKSSSDIPEGPKNIQNGPKSPSDTPKGPRGSSDTRKGPKRPRHIQEGPKSSRKAPKGAKSPRNSQGAPPKDTEGPDGSKAQGPGGPRKVEEGTDALEIDQPPDVSRGAGKAPQGSRGSPRGHNGPQEGQEDPKAPEQVHGDAPRRAGEEPEVPQDGGEDPKGVGGDPTCPWGAGEGPGEGHNKLGQRRGPTKRHDEPGKTHGDPREGRGDPKGGHDDLGQCADPGKRHDDPIERRDDPIEGYDEPKEEHGDLKEGHGDPKFGYDNPKEGYECGDSKEGHDDPTEDHDAHADNPTAEDPWGGRWAWEDSCSSSSSSSSSSDEDLAVEDDGAPLPPPEELGQGNPFLLFVCLAMLLEQREAVMARQGDYNEVAMHFDRLVRRHHLPRVLRRAKALFASYLEGWGGTPAAGPP